MNGLCDKGWPNYALSDNINVLEPQRWADKNNTVLKEMHRQILCTITNIPNILLENTTLNLQHLEKLIANKKSNNTSRISHERSQAAHLRSKSKVKQALKRLGAFFKSQGLLYLQMK